MKQVTQRIRDGRIEVLDVPTPELSPEGVLVDVRASLVSAGTERSKVETGRQTLVSKARSRPDQVRQVVEKAKRDGVSETVQAVRSRLDQPEALGYSAAGVVRAVGARVTDLAPGERVACGGGGYAVHAEVVHVPGNLCVPVPEGMDFDAAAFATVGSIALHGVRQSDARVGERVAVIGLGLVGQLTGQILRAAGCVAVGVDLSTDLIERARALGSVDAAHPRGAIDESALPPELVDCDAVIVTAATRSSDPVQLAARLCRDRARVVIVGDVGMEIPRGPYYDKELDVRLSRSYGPGRYDRWYEERGLDYPIGYVRWTERRNMAAFLDLIASGRVEVQGLITERAPVEKAARVYERLLEAEHSPLGIILEYAPRKDHGAEPPRVAPRQPSPSGLAVGVIGAGSFAQRILIPGFRDAGFSLQAVASSSGLSARAAADRFGFAAAVTPEDVLADPAVDLVAVATTHASHASLAGAALRAGKAVFVEKPPCLSEDELQDLRKARAESGGLFAVGFNRRHASLARELRAYVTPSGAPVELLYRVSAGRLPPDHWLNDLEEGGGRLLGEGCHFVDFACWFTGKPVERVACTLQTEPGRALATGETFTVTLAFTDGGLATIVYGAAGAPGLGKEYVEAHAGGRSGILNDFRSLELLGTGRPRRRRARSLDKGHKAQFVALRRSIQAGVEHEGPDPLDSMAATLAALRSAELGCSVSGFPRS